MNATLSKYLRHLADYRNAAATPYTREFPGLSKNLLRLPVYLTRVVEKRTWDPRFGGYITTTTITKMVHNSREKPVLASPERKIKDGKIVMVPKEDLVARTLPLRLTEKSARGRYRILKRAVKLHGIAAVVKAASTPEVSNA